MTLHSSSDNLFTRQLEHSPLAIVEWDHQYKILRWAGQAEQIFGWQKTEAIDKSFSDLKLIADEDQDRFQAALAEIFSGQGINAVIRNRNRKKNGEMVLIEWFNTAVTNDAGEVVSFLSVGRDLTDEVATANELERSRDRLAFALSTAHLAIWELELDTRRIQVSPELAALFGVDSDSKELTTDALMARVAPEERDPLIATVREAVASRRNFQTEFRVLLPSGGRFGGQFKERWILVSGRAEYDSEGRPNRILGMSQDITKRKQMEEELRQAKRDADMASDLKSRFLANMSHEIRTPLGAILGFSELMADPEIASPDRAEYLQIIQRNGGHLGRLIDDILDLSKVEAGRLEVECVELNPFKLLEEILASHRIAASDRNVCLSLCYDGVLPSRMKTDPVRFKQIVANVVGNALKFTRKGEVSVKVSAEPTPSGSVHMKILVSDSGPGLSPESQKRLFEPFFQADEPGTKGFGGTGLGLTLSRRLARLLGGDIILLKSEIGKGSEFQITIDTREPNSSLRVAKPQVRGVSASGLEKGEESQPLKGLRVLLVEDSPDNQVLMKKLLSKRGAAVEVASDGEEGVRKALGGEYDIVLMDIQMPRLDGYHATQRLRESNYLGPIVALTAHAMKDERERCLEAGCDDHLSKPVNAKDLVRVIREAVSDRALMQ